MIKKSDIVVSTAGRDEGKLFFVMEEDGEFAYLANGRERKIESPKKKKIKHLQFISESECRAAEKLRSGEKLTNSEIRRALSSVDRQNGDEGGM